MSLQAKAKFFCQNCNSEVAANAKFCPKCGKFFAAVRCPKCGHTGTVKDFKHGCPECHYAMTSELKKYGINNEDESFELENELIHNDLHKNFFNLKKRKKPSGNFDDSPTWLLITSIIVLITLFILIFFKCQK